MIKIFTVWLFLCIFIINVHSQTEFAPIGATWYYEKIENMAGEKGYTKILVVMDTTVESKKAKVAVPMYYSSSGTITRRPTIYYYQSSGSVFYYFNGGFRLLYVFNLDKHDTIHVYSNQIYCLHSDYVGYVRIGSITEIVINTKILKKYWTSPLPESKYKFASPYIELVGCLNGIFPTDNTNCIADQYNDFGILRCYSDSSFGSVNFTSAKCDLLVTKIAAISNNNINFNVYCSGSNQITVKYKNRLVENHTIAVYNLTGSEIKRQKIDPFAQTALIQLHNAGIYIIKIFKNSNILYNDKIFVY